jgi:ATP-dependent DNA helicase RecG
VESWGRGMDKMKNLCLEAKIPVPRFSCKGNDFWTVFRKDIYSKEDLDKLGLNERQIDALLFYKEKGEIVSSQYADKYNISDRTARTDLTELVVKGVLNKQGETKLAVYVFPIRK